MRKSLVFVTLFLAFAVVLSGQKIFRDIYSFNNGTLVLSGTGDPEGSVTAPIASIYLRTSNGKWYRKKTGSGNTGWEQSGPVYFSATDRLLCRDTSGAGDAEECTASNVLDMLGATRGSVLYRGASGWTILTPGALNECFKSGGVGADPVYGNCLSGDGGGDVTAASSFANDNRLIRSDGSGKGVQASGITIDDSDNITGGKYDVEGSGNDFKYTAAEKYVFATCDSGTIASLAMSTFSAATKPTAGCTLGSNLVHPYAEMPDSNGEFHLSLDAPIAPGFNSAVADFYIWWSTSATSGDMVGQFQWTCTGDNEALSDTWETAATVTDTAKANANRLNLASITSVTLSTCGNDEMMSLRFMRDRSHASDSISGATVRFYTGWGIYRVTR